MKNRKKILSVLIAALMLLSATPVIAGTAQGSNGITVTLTSPASSETATVPAFTNNVTDAVSPNSDLVFTLQFSGTSNIYDVNTNNIKFYKASETSASAIAVTIAGITLDSVASRYYATSATPVTVTVNSSELTASTAYVLYINGTKIVKKTDSTYNIGKDVYYYISTNDGSAPDTTKPTWSSGSITAAKTNSSIALTWTAATDDTGVSNYIIYKDAVQVATTSALTYTAAGLSAGPDYTFTVKAQDAAGNISDDQLTLTDNVNFTPVFLGKTSGIGINSSLNVGFGDAVAATSFAAISSKAVLTSTGAGVTPTVVPANITLTNSDKVINIDPQSTLAYGTNYELTLSGEIVRTDGVPVSAGRTFDFRTIDFAAPTVQVVSNATSAAAVTLAAGQSYTITVALSNTQSSPASGKVLLVARSGKGTALEYGGDSALQATSFTVSANGSTTATFTYSVPTDDSEAIYFDVYTTDTAGSEFMSSAVHKAFNVQ